jgi:hypothetical protein
MKLAQLLLTAALTATIIMGADKAMASSGELEISGKILTQKAATTKKNELSSSIETVDLKNSLIYSLISNVVLNVGTNGTGLTSTNLPANGYIAFDPSGDDGMVAGTFYVTNKTGFYYPLSGLDTNDNYYSFIEFDAYNDDADNGAGQLNFGFSGNFNGVESGSYNTSTAAGAITVQSSAVFYVHDNPYSFNDGDNANVFYSNNNSFEIRGIAEINITYKAGEIKSWSFSLSGAGNAVVNGTQTGLVSGGKVSSSSSP